MAQCKDCIHFGICKKGFPFADGKGGGWCEDFYTADVAPKSEVERLIGKFECFLCHVTGGRLSKHTYDLGTMESVATDCINETYNEGYGEGYKECARELFDEIYEGCFDQFGYIDYEKLAEERLKSETLISYNYPIQAVIDKVLKEIMEENKK